MEHIIVSAEGGTYWKSIIYDIVTKESFNPWDIDVGLLADSYTEKIKEIRMVNFEVPGTVILIGAVLIKLKSDVVSGQTISFEASLASDGSTYAGIEGDPVADIDDITGKKLPPSLVDYKLLVRRIPKRKVTLPELIVFLKRVIAEVEQKDVVRRDREGVRLDVRTTKKDLERIMRDVYRDIIGLSGEKKSTTFKELVTDWNRESIVAYLLPVLHLANKDKILLEQPEAFGEIFIAAKEGGMTKISGVPKRVDEPETWGRAPKAKATPKPKGKAGKATKKPKEEPESESNEE